MAKVPAQSFTHAYPLSADPPTGILSLFTPLQKGLSHPALPLVSALPVMRETTHPLVFRFPAHHPSIPFSIIPVAPGDEMLWGSAHAVAMGTAKRDRKG
ncbi:hypothetical protein CDAR_468571 [Caerostris darwini]|uniref:Uncharacterized protein n=1 Tax=Caerostris darwini TaxID=1538125 RepID=A0AAV4Q966_9ARAC|nr:hypothetical protein CDAR_468571 [Caerostris darwini]